MNCSHQAARYSDSWCEYSRCLARSVKRGVRAAAELFGTLVYRTASVRNSLFCEISQGVSRRGARAAEWAGLLSRYGVTAIVGSNPTLSASST